MKETNSPKKMNLKIKNTSNFWLGFFLLIISVVSFSYVNHAAKYKIENCYKVEGRIKNITELYSEGSISQDGWMIELDSINYKIRITGEYYNALNKDLFSKYAIKNNRITVYILKEETGGVFQKVNSSLGIRDAAVIRYNEHELLSLTNVKRKMQHLFILNLSIGLIAAGLGIYFVLKSLK